ncbi:hypothetical protein C2G38_2193538 [Gigaspora rosea]|uniref:Uncharacterized protein n=1 Tax=Gigaspora rosea TaxID=44941 RepID=A0A397V4V4_9GLOM|nr:hypothetical protein C2G38_2193538 [Gigaspora rosea]
MKFNKDVAYQLLQVVTDRNKVEIVVIVIIVVIAAKIAIAVKVAIAVIEPKAVITEIELKKMTHLSEVSRQKSGKLPSKEVVASFVKSLQLGVPPFRSFGTFEISTKWAFRFTPPKDRQCLLLSNWERLPIWSRRHEWPLAAMKTVNDVTRCFGPATEISQQTCYKADFTISVFLFLSF